MNQTLHNMTGDTSASEGLQGGSGRPWRRCFGNVKDESAESSKWRRTVDSDTIAFSDFGALKKYFVNEKETELMSFDQNPS